MTTIPLSTIDRSLIEDALSSLGANNTDAIRTDYSGRAMYGEQCLGIVLPGEHLIRFTAELTALLMLADDDNGYDTATDLFARARTDDMGLDVILYFPGWNLAE